MAIKKEALAEWAECDARRRALEAEARTLKARCDQLVADFSEELKQTGKTSIVRHGFTLAWVVGRVSVAWAEAYLRDCGADAAAKLKAEAAAKSKQSLSITPPA